MAQSGTASVRPDGRCAQKRRIHYNRLVIRGDCRPCPWARRTWSFRRAGAAPCAAPRGGSATGPSEPGFPRARKQHHCPLAGLPAQPTLRSRPACAGGTFPRDCRAGARPGSAAGAGAHPHTHTFPLRRRARRREPWDARRGGAGAPGDPAASGVAFGRPRMTQPHPCRSLRQSARGLHKFPVTPRTAHGRPGPGEGAAASEAARGPRVSPDSLHLAPSLAGAGAGVRAGSG